jgi:pimeloyl-ACP methyl ester carboxylesterase
MTSSFSSPVATGYAPTGDLELYYEIHGAGQPLILLHGGFGAGSTFGPLLPLLAESRQVITVDLQGHGRTADIDRSLSYEALADDIAGLISYLKLEQPAVMGYSLGGGVALQTAIRHPQVVGKLVLLSVPMRRSGWFPEMRAGMDQMGPATAPMLAQAPFYAHYAQVAPRPEDWPVLVGKMGELLRREYDWSAELAALPMPVLLAVGDADGLPVSHAAEMFEFLGGSLRDGGWDGSGLSRSQLAVLPRTTHYGSSASPLLAPIVLSFLGE